MIEVYGNEGCGKCKIIKKKLEDKNIDHTYSTDQDEMLEVAGKFKTRELPICVVDGEHYQFSKMNRWVNDYDG